MPQLALSLLGSPRIERDGAPVRIDRRKALALLAYLTMTGESHSRDKLATLLWPELDQSRARAGLRAALSTLKKALGDGWLEIDRESTGLGPVIIPPTPEPRSSSANALWLDVAEFRDMLAQCRTHGHREEQVCPDCLPVLERAAELYRDDFLAGFTLRDSPLFDEWQFFQTEGLRKGLLGTLARLAQGHADRGELPQAIAYARRWVALDPLHEPAHRQLMRLYAQSGERAAALRQYETCRQVLRAELGAEPADETTSQYRAILSGTMETATPAPDHLPDARLRPPAFLSQESQEESPAQVFVARERELAQLDAHLAAAVAGRGGVVFVTGEEGCGKTALLAEFTQRAQEAYADLRAVSGTCSAYSGIGDPYLPFRDVMDMLAGDVEARWQAGLISGDQARRLWEMLPDAAQAMVNSAPDVVDVFVPGRELVSRAEMVTPSGASWLAELKELAARKQAGTTVLQPDHLMGEYANLLRSLAAIHPLLITLDDLQWADVASASLLFYLARNLAGSRILLVGAYRPEEVALGRDGERHPLQKALNEFKRTFGDVWIDLSAGGEREGREFVDAFLDTEPNRLGQDFRQALFRQTDGHPLFTIELLRGMHDRGSLVCDEEQQWVEGPALDWSALPVRVEGVIEERLARLEPALHEMLSVASVEGERFTAQVVARVRGLGEGQVLRDLSQLERRHRLVREREGVRVDGRFLSRYQFSHILFQRYLYEALSASERRLLHGEIAGILEEMYEGRADEIAVQLAGHYSEAGEREKAVEYLLQAGDRARGLYAYQEAIDYYQQALAFLKELGEHEQAARTLMGLGLTYHLALDFPRSRQAYDEGFALWQRAGEIQEGTPPLPAPHALRVGLEIPTGLDPAVNIDMYSIAIIDQLFSGLVEQTPALGVAPDVARSWEVSEGGRKYVFHLRDDVRWTDGTPVTAGDFEYAWKRALDPATRLPAASLLNDVKGALAFHQGHISDAEQVGVRALDDVTLEVELEGPTSYFPHLLTLCGSYPVPRHVVEAHGEAWTEVENIVTNGPFRLEAWQRGQSAVLVRNPAYHSQFTGNVQRVEVSLLEDPSARLALYEADGLDILLAELRARLDRARHRHAGEYIRVPGVGTEYVGFDASRPPFDDPRVRRAFVLATDRGTLLDDVLGATGYSPATGGYLPPGMLGHSAGIALPCDPHAAQQLLAEAGYPGGHDFPAVNMLTNYARAAYGEYLQAHWRENLGVAIAQETLAWEILLDRLDRDPPYMFCVGGEVNYPDPDALLRAPYFQQITRWQNETYDRLVEEARRITDPGERTAMYQEADRILVEEAAIMPLTYAHCNLMVKPWVKRLPTSATKFWFWKDVIIEPH